MIDEQRHVRPVGHARDLSPAPGHHLVRPSNGGGDTSVGVDTRGLVPATPPLDLGRVGAEPRILLRGVGHGGLQSRPRLYGVFSGPHTVSTLEQDLLGHRRRPLTSRHLTDGDGERQVSGNDRVAVGVPLTLQLLQGDQDHMRLPDGAHALGSKSAVGCPPRHPHPEVEAAGTRSGDLELGGLHYDGSIRTVPPEDGGQRSHTTVLFSDDALDQQGEPASFTPASWMALAAKMAEHRPAFMSTEPLP